MNKRNLLRSVLIVSAFVATCATEPMAQTIVNDRFWKDTDGNFIYSQGGGVLQVGDTYYWYGVKYNGAVTYAANPTGKNSDTGFAGVTCYSSKDLVNWKYEGLALDPKQAGGGWFGRIGVVYNAKTKKYVLAGQGASPSWEFGEYFATSDTPTGPFKFARVQPESEMTFFVNNNTGDQTLFQDDDGKAYVIASNVKGRTNLYVAPLRESDFLAIDGSKTVNIHKSRVGGREGNAMFKHDGVYYFCSSDLHGWNTSQTYCMSATNILGPYSEEFVLEGTQHDFSHVTQTGFFVMVNGTKGSFVVNAGDRWSDFAGNGLGYNQWLPISFESGKPVFHSLSEWNINVKEGTWSVGANNNYCLNPTFEADRVSQTTLTGWKLDKPDANNINSTSKKRTGRFGLYLTDTKTVTQMLTVPNGKYTLSAYVQSSGGQTASVFAKDFGGTEKSTAVSAASSWTKKVVEDINVTNGKITIGFSTKGSSSQWLAVDDIELIRSGKSYKVSVVPAAGGTIAQSIEGAEIAEGSKVTFTAVPLEGWEFTGWTGDNSGTAKEYTIASLNKDVSLGANFKFIGKDSLKYEAENTVFNQTILEKTHEGFSGEGYANLDNQIGSSITFGICLPSEGEKKVKIVFANGGKSDRPVSIAVNGITQIEKLSMDITGEWTTWKEIETTLDMPAGISTLTITSLTADGAANIDYIEFEGDKSATELSSSSSAENGSSSSAEISSSSVTEVTSSSSIEENESSSSAEVQNLHGITVAEGFNVNFDPLSRSVRIAGATTGTIQLYNTMGMIVHQAKIHRGNSAETYLLPQSVKGGIYFLRVKAGSNVDIRKVNILN